MVIKYEILSLPKVSEQNRRYKIAHLATHLQRTRHEHARGELGISLEARADAAKPTFAVVGEMEQEGLKAAGVGPELVPDDLTEEDDGDVVLHLKTAGV